MSETTNYGLHLTDDSSETFLNWRTKMNGTDPDSNMQIIDKALGEKADHNDQLTGVLSADAWEGDEAPYTQEVSIEGLEAEQDGEIGLSQEATADERQAAREAMLNPIGQSDGKLVIAADGSLPEIDIPFVITLFK